MKQETESLEQQINALGRLSGPYIFQLYSEDIFRDVKAKHEIGSAVPDPDRALSEELHRFVQYWRDNEENRQSIFEAMGLEVPLDTLRQRGFDGWRRFAQTATQQHGFVMLLAADSKPDAKALGEVVAALLPEVEDYQKKSQDSPMAIVPFSPQQSRELFDIEQKKIAWRKEAGLIDSADAETLEKGLEKLLHKPYAIMIAGNPQQIERGFGRLFGVVNGLSEKERKSDYNHLVTIKQQWMTEASHYTSAISAFEKAIRDTPRTAGLA